MFLTETRCIDSREPGDFPGEFVQLRDGVTHYQVSGPLDGQPVVCVHGYSVPGYIWDPTAEALAAAGFRVIRYDLFGRGGSDRPDTDYDLALFERQLVELTQALCAERPAHLLAICMGGIIAAHTLCRHPRRFERLALVGPAGFPTDFPFYTWLLRVPFWGDLLMQLYGDRQLLQALDSHFHRPDRFPEYRARYHIGLKYAGIKRALVSTARHVPFEDCAELYRALGAQQRELLLLWGEQDRVLPFALHEEAQRALPRAAFQPVPEAGHAAHYERPDLVNPRLVEFFSAAKSKPRRRRASVAPA